MLYLYCHNTNPRSVQIQLLTICFLSDDKLCTVALRPNVMFGEEDPHFVPGCYKSSVAAGGIFVLFEFPLKFYFL